jgi:hypothetical protein
VSCCDRCPSNALLQECPSYKIAHHIASTLSTSMLLKCAIHGADANWGRVLCAVGYSDAADFTIDPSKVSVTFADADGRRLELLVDGEPVPEIDEVLAKEMLDKEEVFIQVKMGQGEHAASYYTCDLSKVRILGFCRGCSFPSAGLRRHQRLLPVVGRPMINTRGVQKCVWPAGSGAVMLTSLLNAQDLHPTLAPHEP